MELQMIVGWTERGIAPGASRVRNHSVVELRTVEVEEMPVDGSLRISVDGRAEAHLDLHLLIAGGKARVETDIVDDIGAYGEYMADKYRNLTRRGAKVGSYTGLGDKGYGWNRSEHPVQLPGSLRAVAHSTRDTVMAMVENTSDTCVVSEGRILRTVGDLHVAFAMDGDDVFIVDIADGYPGDKPTPDPTLDGEGRFIHKLAPQDFVAMVENGSLDVLYRTARVKVERTGDLDGLSSRRASPDVDAASLVLSILAQEALMTNGVLGRAIRTCAMSAMETIAEDVGDTPALLSRLDSIVSDPEFTERFGDRPALLAKNYAEQVERISVLSNGRPAALAV